MRFTYSPAADALYIELASGDRRVARTQSVAPGVTMDLAEDGRVLGFELLGASVHVPPVELVQLDAPNDWLTLAEASALAAEEEGTIISPTTLRVQLNARRIQGKKGKGGEWQIARHELFNYLENRAPSGRRGQAPAAQGLPHGGLMLVREGPPVPWSPRHAGDRQPRKAAKLSGKGRKKVYRKPKKA